MAAEQQPLLEVWLSGQPAGLLSLVEGRLHFRYHAAWLEAPGAMPLSQSLPLQPQAFHDGACRAFFAGLLPEGQLRILIARALQVSVQNDYALLAAIGGECAGAVSLLPPGWQPPAGLESTAAEEDAVEWLEPPALASLLEELPRRPMLAGRDGMRLSLAGAQDKLPVVFDGRRIGLPRGSTPSSHILKPAITAVEDSVLNEAYCMALAQALGMEVAQTQLLPVADRPVLLVRRYDRRSDGSGRCVRIHQEDVCQALGVDPERKYQNEGGPDLAACFSLLRAASRPSAPQVLRLLDAVVFNALVGNHDAHAKNVSLLYGGGGSTATLAPLYDVLCTAIYPQLTAKMAMKIGSKYKFSEVQARHWQQFAQATGLALAPTRKRVLRMAEQLPAAAARLQAEEPFRDAAIVARIVAVIEQRSALTRRRLGGG